MTDAAPDIPPWSPLADRARQVGEPGAVATMLPPVATTDGGGTDAPDRPDPPDRDGRGRPVVWLAVGLAAGLVLALVGSLVLAEDAPAPPTTTTVRDPQPSTSFDDPAPRGSRVALGNGWTVSVRGFDPGATRPLRPLNRQAAPLRDGQAYVLIDLEMTYQDGRADSEAPFYGVDLSVVGENGSAVTTADSPCVAPEPRLDVETDVGRGASERGRICFAVDADQVPTLRLVAQPSMTYGSEASYLALDAPG